MGQGESWRIDLGTKKCDGICKVIWHLDILAVFSSGTMNHERYICE